MEKIENNPESESSKEQIKSVGSTKTYIAPRIDSLWFQAELPESIDFTLKERESVRNKLSYSAVNSNDQEDFIVAARQIFCPTYVPNGSIAWTENHNDIPLEFDELAIDYLHKYNNNGQIALFHLSLELGHGKEYVFCNKTMESAKRHSTGISFMENREKYIQSNIQPIAGMLCIPRLPMDYTLTQEKTLSTTSSSDDDSISAHHSMKDNSTHKPSSSHSVRSRYLGTSNANTNTTSSSSSSNTPNNHIKSNSITTTIQSTTNIPYNNHNIINTSALTSLDVQVLRREDSIDHILLFSESTDPNNIVPEIHENFFDQIALKFDANNNNNNNTTVNTASSSTKSSPKNDINTNNNNNNMNKEGGGNSHHNDSISEGRTTRVPGGTAKENKNQLKKEWQIIYKQASDFLQKCQIYKTLNIGSYNMSKQVSEQEVWTLLVNASKLNTYNNGPGESFGETVRSCLGELLQLCIGSQQWGVEVRDALYDDVDPPISLNKLHALERHGRSLPIVNMTILSQLRSVFKEYNDIKKTTKMLIYYFTHHSIHKWNDIFPDTGIIHKVVHSEYGEEGSTDDSDHHISLTETSSSQDELIKLTRDELCQLVHRIHSLPKATVLHTYSKPLEYIAQYIEKITEEMMTVIYKAEICDVRKQRVPSIQWRSDDSNGHGHRTAVGSSSGNTTTPSSSSSSSDLANNSDISLTNGNTTTTDKSPDNELTTRMSLKTVQELRQRVLTLPITLPHTQVFLAIIDKGEVWQKQVHDLMKEDQTFTKATTTTTTQSSSSGKQRGSATSSSSSSSSSSSTTQSQGKAVSLKRVETLIAEGENLAFQFTQEMCYLSEKRALAKVWLDKLKKSFQVRNTSSQQRVASLRKNATGANTSTSGGMKVDEKIKLSDMKMMVEEGQAIVDDDDTMNGGGTSGSNSSSSGSGRTVQIRELNKAQSAVEIAEEWINKMKELLDESYAELERTLYTANTDEDTADVQSKENMKKEKSATPKSKSKAQRTRKNSEDNSIEGKSSRRSRSSSSSSSESDDVSTDEKNDKNDIEEDDDEEEESQDQRSVIEILREMLLEANDMPVQMDETAILRVHLKALDWAQKARKVLPPMQPSSGEVDQPISAVISSVPTAEETTDRMSTEKAKLRKKPTYNEIQKLVSEIKSIRTELTPDMIRSFGVRTLPDEERCISVLKEADTILAITKKLVQSNSVRKGARLIRYVDILARASLLPITFNNELKLVTEVVKMSEEWLSKNIDMLKKLDIPVDINRTNIASYIKQYLTDSTQSSDAMDKEDIDNDNKSESKDLYDNGDDDKKKSSIVKSEIISDSSTSNKSIFTATVTLSELIQLVKSADHILIDVPEIKAIKDRLQKAQQWMQQVKDMKNSTESTISAVATAVSSSSETTSNTTSSSSSSSPARPRTISLSIIEELLTRGYELKLVLTDEIQLLQNMCDEVKRWDESIEDIIRNQLLPALHSLISQYVSYTESWSHLSALNYPYFQGITNQSLSQNTNIFDINDKAHIIEALLKSSAMSSYPYSQNQENKLWIDMKNVKNILMEIQKKGQVTGYISSYDVDISMGLNIIEWITDVRNLFISESYIKKHTDPSKQHITTPPSDGKDYNIPTFLWGDAPMPKIMSLLRDCEWLLQKFIIDSDDMGVSKDAIVKYPALDAFSYYHLYYEINDLVPSTTSTTTTTNTPDSIRKEGESSEMSLHDHKDKIRQYRITQLSSFYSDSIDHITDLLNSFEYEETVSGQSKVSRTSVGHRRNRVVVPTTTTTPKETTSSTVPTTSSTSTSTSQETRRKGAKGSNSNKKRKVSKQEALTQSSQDFMDVSEVDSHTDDIDGANNTQEDLDTSIVSNDVHVEGTTRTKRKSRPVEDSDFVSSADILTSHSKNKKAVISKKQAKIRQVSTENTLEILDKSKEKAYKGKISQGSGSNKSSKKRARFEDTLQGTDDVIIITDSTVDNIIDNDDDEAMKVEESAETGVRIHTSSPTFTSSINYISRTKKQILTSLRLSTMTSSNQESNEKKRSTLLMSYRVSLINILSYWYQLIQFFKLRIKESLKWNSEITVIDNAILDFCNNIFLNYQVNVNIPDNALITAFTANKIQLNEKLFISLLQQLQIAQHRHIMSTTRYEIQEFIIESKLWYRRAYDMFHRVHNSLLPVNDLTTFIKRGEKIFLYGEGLHQASCITTTTATTSTTSSDDSTTINGNQNAPGESMATSDTSQTMDIIESKTSNVINTADKSSDTSSSSSSSNIASNISQNKVQIHPFGFYTMILKLKKHLKASKVWISNIQEFNTAMSAGTANYAEIDLLLQQAEKLAVNLEEYTDTIQQVIKCYCFCRLGYHGEMIGCDQCTEWYHYTCIGMTTVLAGKCEKYVCLRCSLHTQFFEAATAVANITNRWMKPVDHSRYKESKRSKVERRRTKEEKEYQMTEKKLQELIELRQKVVQLIEVDNKVIAATYAATYTSSIIGPVGSGSGGGSGSSTNDVNMASLSAAGDMTANVSSIIVPELPSSLGIRTYTITPELACSIYTVGSTANPATLNTQIAHFTTVLSDIKNKLDKLKSEEDHMKKQNTIESLHKKSAYEWMLAMQGVMWPTNPEDREIGQPVSPPGFHESIISTKFQYTLHSMGLDTDLLSPGMKNARDASVVLELHELDDVQDIFHYFKLMSWINITLYCLRRPMPTYAYQQLINAGQGLKFHDEKTMKILSAIHTRASVWKGKTRKLLQVVSTTTANTIANTASSGWIEASKVKAIVDEAVGHPIISRLKEKMTNLLTEYHTHYPPPAILPTPTIGSSQDTTITTTSSTDPNKSNSSAGSGSGTTITATGTAPTTTTATKRSSKSSSSKSASSLPIHPSTHIRIQDPIVNSTDEENDTTTIVSPTADSEGGGEKKIVHTGYTYQYPNTLQPAAKPNIIWPVKLSVERHRLVMSTTVSNLPPSSSSSSSSVPMTVSSATPVVVPSLTSGGVTVSSGNTTVISAGTIDIRSVL